MSSVGAIHDPQLRSVEGDHFQERSHLSCCEKTRQLFKKVVSSPCFWATIAVATFTISATALIGILNLTLVPLIVLGSTGILASGVIVYLYCKNKEDLIEDLDEEIDPLVPSEKDFDEEIEPPPTPEEDLRQKTVIIYPIKEAEETSAPREIFSSSPVRIKVAAHVLGGAGIREASIGGVRLEGSNFSTTAPALLMFLTSDEARATEHRTMIGILKQLIYFDNLTRIPSTDTKVLIPHHIKRMAVGETLTLPGGWAKTSVGHAMVYQIRRDSEERFTFIVINSGAGINYHPDKSTHNKLKFAPSIVVNDIPLEMMLNPHAWDVYGALLRLPREFEPNQSFRHEDFVYHRFLQCFCPQFIEKAKGEWGDYITPQKAGTCTNDVLFALMRRQSSSVNAYKSLKNQYKSWIVEKCIGLEVKALSSTPATSLNNAEITSALASIKLLGYFLNRFAKSMEKALKKEGQMFLKEAERANLHLTHLQAQLKKNKNELQGSFERRGLGLSAFTGKKFQLITDDKLYERKKAASLHGVVEKSPYEIKIDPVWKGSRPFSVSLEEWVKGIEVLIHAKTKEAHREAHWHLQAIFAAMPRASDPFWNKFHRLDRSGSQEEKEKMEGSDLKSILRQMAQLHKWFFQTLDAIEVDKQERLVDKTLIRKNTQVLGKLCARVLGEKEQEFSLERHRVFIKESAFLSFPEECCHDEELMPKASTPLFTLYPPEKLFETNFSNETPLVKLVLKHLTEENKKRMIEEISKDPKLMRVPPHLALVAHAIANHRRYLPETFSVMIEVAFIDCVIKERTFEGYSNNSLIPQGDKSPLKFASTDFTKIEIEVNSSRQLISCLLIYEKASMAPLSKSPLTLHRTAPFSDRFQGVCQRLTYTSSAEQNSRAMELSSFEKKLLLARCLNINISYRARDLINLYTSNYNRLSEPEEQFLFELLIFERDVLRSALAAGPFAPVLAHFVEGGYRFAEAAREIPTQLFFLRLGSYFETFTKGAVRYPDLMKATDTLLTLPGLTDEHRALILRERLAHQGRSTQLITQGAWKQILEDQQRYQSLELPLDYQNHKLDENIGRLAYKLRQFLVGKSEKDVHEITSGIFEGTPPEISFPFIYTRGPETDIEDRRCLLNLFTFQVFHKGAQVHPLPKTLKESDPFIKCFIDGERMTARDVAANNSLNIVFKDRFGNRCKAYCQKGTSDWFIHREIEGITYRYVAFSGEGVIPATFKCSIWTNGVQEGILIDETTGRIFYRYNRDALTCIVPDEREGHFFVQRDINDPRQNFFAAFDLEVLFWADKASSEIQVIDFPSYNFKIKREGERNLLTGPYAGYVLDTHQSLSQLLRISGALVVRKGEERRVLIPRRILKEKDSHLESFNAPLQFESKSEGVYEYHVDHKGRLSSPQREASLYLIYLYLIQRNYEGALKLLNKVSKTISFNKDELFWLNAIDATAPLLTASRANAIRLLIKLIRLENKNSIDEGRAEIKLNENLPDYIKNFSGLPPEFVISPRRIMNWAPEGGFGSLESNYLKLITTSPVAPRRFPRTPSPIKPPQTHTQMRSIGSLLLQLSIIQREFRASPEGAQMRPLSDQERKEQEEKVRMEIETLEKEGAYGLITTKNSLKKHFRALYRQAYLADTPENKDAVRALIYLAVPLPETESDLIIRDLLLCLLKSPKDFPHPNELIIWPDDLNSRIFNAAQKNWKDDASQASNATLRALRRDFSGYRPPETFVTEPPILFHHSELEIKEALDLPTTIHSRFKNDAALLFRLHTEGDEKRGKEEAREKEERGDSESLTTLLSSLASNESDTVAQEALRELGRDVAFFEAHHKTSLYEEVNQKELTAQIRDTEEGIRKLKESEDRLKASIERLGNKLATDPKEASIDLFGHQAKLKRLLKVDDFLIPYIRADFSYYRRRNRHLNEEEARTLHREIGTFLLIRTERQRLERYQEKLHEYQAVNLPATDKELLSEYAQNALNEINAERHYHINKHPEYLVFEYKRNLALRKQQVEGLDALLDEGGGNTVLQLIMGGGKTDIMAILLAVKKANGTNLSIMMVPDELMPDFSTNLEKQKRIFETEVRLLNWNDVSLANLKRIYNSLLDTVRAREILLVSDGEIKRFLLSAEQALFEHGENKERIKFFRAIKLFLKRFGGVTIDEIHKQDSRHDYRVATGEEESIDRDYLHLSTLLYNILIYDREISQNVSFEFSPHKLAGATPFVPSFFESIKQRLLEATLSSKELHEKIPELEMILKALRVPLMTFLMDRPGGKAQVPNFSKLIKSPQRARRVSQLLCFLRAQMEILPETLSKRLNERYGIFPRLRDNVDISFLAGPFKSARTPNIGSQFGNYIEQINYTIQANIKEIPLAAFKQEIERIQALKAYEVSLSIPQEGSVAFKEYCNCVGDEFATTHPVALTKISEEVLGEWLSLLNRDAGFKFRFIENYILPTIRPQTNVLVCDAQNLFGAFKRVTGYTGTPKPELSLKFQVKKARGTDGQVIALIHKHKNQRLIALNDSLDAREQLRFLLTKPGKEHFHALIDAGALFKDIPPKSVAETILATRSDIDFVIYYEEALEGSVGQLLQRSKDNELRKDKKNFFVFFGQNQCTGINHKLPLEAHAFLTTNPGISYTNLSQGAMRMRGLAQGQRVHLVATESLVSLISKKLGNKPIESVNGVDCCLFAKLVEAQKEADDNLLNIKQQMREIVLEAVREYLDKIPLEKLNSAAHLALAQLLKTKATLDPSLQFTKLDQLMDVASALEHFSLEALAAIRAWHNEHRRHSISRYAPLISLETLSRKMTLFVEALKAKRHYFKKEVTVSAPSGKGSEVAVKTQQKTKSEQEQKTEQEQKAELEMDERNPDLSLACSGAPHLTLSQLIIGDHSKIKSLNRAIELRNTFSPNLYISEDFSKTVSNRTPFKGHYKPITVCLIERSIRSPSNVRMILISQAEAGAIEDELRTFKNTDFEYCLSYPKIGSWSPRPLEGLDVNEEFRMLSLQYLVLSGVTSIPSTSIPLLEKWLRSMPNMEAFEKFYLSAMAKEKDLLKAYRSSYLKTAIMRVQGALSLKTDCALTINP